MIIVSWNLRGESALCQILFLQRHQLSYLDFPKKCEEMNKMESLMTTEQ